MKLTLKKALSLLVAAAMLLSLAACADKTAGTAAPAASTDTSASAGINRDAVAVRVGDRDITAGEIADMYTQYVSMYQAYGMAAPTADRITAKQSSRNASLVSGAERGQTRSHRLT